MLKSIAISAAIAFSLVASATQDSQGGEDSVMPIPGKFLKQGESIQCSSEDGCIVMTVKELVDTANAIQQKVLEDHVCGLKSNV